MDQNVGLDMCKKIILKTQNWILPTSDSFPLIMSHMSLLRFYIPAIIFNPQKDKCNSSLFLKTYLTLFLDRRRLSISRTIRFSSVYLKWLVCSWWSSFLMALSMADRVLNLRPASSFDKESPCRMSSQPYFNRK